MTSIAITGLPITFSRKQLVFLLTPVIRGKFEVLKYDHKLNKTKTCYIRLLKNQDVLEILKKINVLRVGHNKLLSFVPSQNSDLPVETNLKIISANLNKPLNIEPGYTEEMVIQHTHEQILLEMQSIYTGLYALNNRTGDKLLEAIGQIVYDRLELISKNQKIESIITLSKLYRRTYPHFADFQFILTTLHNIQEKLGKPKLEVEEKELLTAGLKPFAIDNLSQEEIKATSEKYSEKIITAVLDHVNKLSMVVDPKKNNIEEGARIEVRKHLKYMKSYIPNIIRNVVSKHLAPPQGTYYIVKIYGEPSLPTQGQLRIWAHSYSLYSVTRSERVYNLMMARCPCSRYTALLAADGTLLGKSKLIIRSEATPYKKVPIKKLNEEKTSMNKSNNDLNEEKHEDADMEWTGEW